MNSSGDLGQTVAKVVTWGQQQVAAAKAERQRRLDPYVQAQERRAVAQSERQRLLAMQAGRQRRFQSRLKRLKVRATTGLYGAIGGASLGVVDTITLAAGDNGVVPGSPGMWFLLAATSGLISARARTQLHNATPPEPLALPVVPPPLLNADQTGAAEAGRFARAEIQLREMLPAVDELHHEAAESVRQTLATVQPNMYALIERLDLLSRVDVVAAPQVAEAAETLRRRLAQGVSAYERLIAATAVLLAAPDPGGPASEQLTRVEQELQAYSAGLAAASEAFDLQ